MWLARIQHLLGSALAILWHNRVFWQYKTSTLPIASCQFATKNVFCQNPQKEMAAGIPFISELALTIQARTLRPLILVLFVLLLFTPLILEFIFVSDLFAFAQRIFAYWDTKTEAVFLSDLLFTEAAVLILFGALLAGTILYSSWAAMDVRQVQFSGSIWDWKRMKKEPTLL